MISLLVGFLASLCLAIWALDRREGRGLEARRDRLVAAVANRTVAAIVRNLKSENEGLKKQLGMSPMRRPALQAEPEVAEHKLRDNRGSVQLGQYQGPMLKCGDCAGSVSSGLTAAFSMTDAELVEKRFAEFGDGRCRTGRWGTK